MKPTIGIHAMRHLNISQNNKKARLIITKMGNAIPNVENSEKSEGLIRSLNPTSNITMTEAIFAPAIILIVSSFNFFITIRGSGQTISSSLLC